MTISQTEIDALLNSAGDLAESAQSVAAPAGSPTPLPAMDAPPRPKVDWSNLPPEVRRTLRIKVPAIVTLAEREFKLESVLGWTLGSIIESEVPADADLKLLIANKLIGMGHAVKAGENFGIRITAIGDVNDRIMAMGPT